MALPKPVGRNAAARKYDLLTAMGTHALASANGQQRLILRFMTLITARYNWSRDELAVGQREIARLWHCDERTVKRETAKLRAKRWLIVHRQGARGRVTQYKIDIERILSDTEPQWDAVGPDFVLRLGETPPSDIVPLPVKGRVDPPTLTDDTEWTLAQAILHAEDEATYGAWLRHLKRRERQGARLVLAAPSRFHAAYVETHLKARVLAACRAVDDGVGEVALVL